MDYSPPPRPSLRQLQYFVAVAELNAFGTAAETLAVSQPSLSKQLATMEVEMGVSLFERTSRRVTLTSAGEKLLPRARMILQEVREFQAIARGSIGLFGDKVSIGVLPSVGAYFMPAAMRELHKLYPDLRVVIQEGSTKHLLSMLENGQLDTVIGTPTNNPGYVCRHLFVETLWACSAADDPLFSSHKPLKLKELANKPLLSLSPEFRLADVVERLANLAGTFVSRDYEGASLDAVRQMAVMGAGVAILPSLYALAEAVRDPEFIIRRIDHPEAKHNIALTWRRNSPLEEDCVQLADRLIEVKRDIRDARPERFR